MSEAKQSDLTGLLSLTAEQENTISMLSGVEKVFIGAGSHTGTTMVYVNCKKGIAAISDDGQIYWQR